MCRESRCSVVLWLDSWAVVCSLSLSLQVARTINNMQQQIQQHQRQLAQALLMKQQPPPPHLSLHPSAGKSAMDSFSPHPQAPGLPDLQTKEQQSSPNTFAPYPLGEWPPAAAPSFICLIHCLNIWLHSITNADINIYIFIKWRWNAQTKPCLCGRCSGGLYLLSCVLPANSRTENLSD